MLIEARQEGESAQDPSGKIVSPWTFDVKVSCDTQFTFRSLMFVAGEDENLKMLPPRPALERLALVYGQAPCFLAISSTSDDAYSSLNPSSLNPYVGSYIRTAKLVQDISIVTSILQPSAGASSSSSSTVSPDQDSANDYPEIRGSTCEDSIEEGHLIIMVASVGRPSHNSSSRYPTIGRSEASDACTPNDGMIQNLNPDFNVTRLQTIMESIQRMAPEGSPLVDLAQQGAEAANFIIVQRSIGNPRGEPSVDNRSIDRVKRARSEAAASTSGNHRLADNDAHR
jgi:hypothetical protein